MLTAALLRTGCASRQDEAVRTAAEDFRAAVAAGDGAAACTMLSPRGLLRRRHRAHATEARDLARLLLDDADRADARASERAAVSSVGMGADLESPATADWRAGSQAQAAFRLGVDTRVQPDCW